MARSRRTKGSDRTSRFGLWGKGPALRRTSTSALTSSAGRVESDFESLENRQLLFALTIDPLDPSFVPSPVPGYGTVSVDFGYTIPYLAPTQEPADPQATTEDHDFNEGDPQFVPSGTVFEDNWRVRHNAANAILRLDDDAPPQTDDLELFFSLNPGQFVSWQFAIDPDDPTNPPNPARDVQSLSSMTWFIDDPGFDPDLITVELRMRDEVVASFTGAELLALNPLGTPNGVFTFTVPGVLDPAFDELRIVNTGGSTTTFSMDDVSAVLVDEVWVDIVEDRIFGARVVFSGPIGASAQFLDLYGREMRATIELLKWSDEANVLAVDLNGDGVPDFNDGIGRINISGTDDRTAITMFGLTLAGTISGGITATLPDDILGLYDDFEAGGMGFFATPVPGQQAWVVTGMPPGGGSVVIGSPFIRDNSDRSTYLPGLPAVPSPVVSGFTRTDQGVFVVGGASISSVYFHAMTFGHSRFSATADRFIVGTLLGSVNVAGDLGTLMVAGDAGTWTDDDGTPAMVRTGSQITIGRTVREIAIGGRSQANVTVIGDLNSPNTRPPRDVLRYYENEFAGVSARTSTPPGGASIAGTLANNASVILNKTFGGIRFSDQALTFGTGFFRNDTLMSAEWIGSIATAVEVIGDLGAFDAINQAADPSDVYAFAATGDQDITVRLTSGVLGTLYFRVVDRDGRTVAAPEFLDTNSNDVALRFRPNQPGTYYLVVQSAADTAGNVAGNAYVLTVAGMASTTIGAHRTAGSVGRNRVGQGNVINVLSGSMGDLRVGTGFITGAGGEATPGGIINVSAAADENDADEYMSLRSMTLSVARDLFAMTLGSDIEGDTQILAATVTVGRNLGTVITGQAPSIGINPREGDLRGLNMTVGGSIAMLDIRGSVGIDGDAANFPLSASLPGDSVIRTGTNPNFKGDIGWFRVGGHVGGDTLILRTGNGSTVGAFLVSQDIAFDQADPNIGITGAGGDVNGLDLRLGINSDIRFFDTPKIDNQRIEDKFFAIAANGEQIFTDDAGGQVRIRVIGGVGTASALVRVIPIAGSLGVAIGRVEADLTGGARLQITSLGAVGSTDVISIGHIIIRGADAASSIGIDGNAQVDVWRIQQLGGDEFNEVVNLSPNGDIVAVDMVALDRLELGTGDLGRTQLRPWGPQRIGPFIGIDDDEGGVGGPINLDAASVNGFWNGDLFRPVNDSVVSNAESYLDDIGAPVDPYLNGLIVRTGDITLVTGRGAIGDVIASAESDGGRWDPLESTCRHASLSIL